MFFAKSGYEVTGIDICEDAIRLANLNKVRYNLENLKFFVSDYEDIYDNLKEDKFDIVVFYDSLHHAENEFLALKCAYDVLKVGGVCITVEPGRFHGIMPASRKAVETYGVNEKSMPASKIIKIAKIVGFKEGKEFFSGETIVNHFLKKKLNFRLTIIRFIKILISEFIYDIFGSSVTLLKK